MTKKEFIEKWGHICVEGGGSAKYDFTKEFEEDLQSFLSEINKGYNSKPFTLSVSLQDNKDLEELSDEHRYLIAPCQCPQHTLEVLSIDKKEPETNQVELVVRCLDKDDFHCEKHHGGKYFITGALVPKNFVS